MVRNLEHSSSRIALYEDKFSKRIRVDDYSGSIDEVIQLILVSTPEWVEKIIVKVRPEDLDTFVKKGFREEAVVSKYFAGVDMHFLVQYPFPQRQLTMKAPEEEEILHGVLKTGIEGSNRHDFLIAYASHADAADLAQLYRESFPVYPTPVGDPEFVRKTIREGTLYAFIRDQKMIVSAASAEINRKYKNAELTDCATRKGAQGKGYMRALLIELERNLRMQGITCLYTIARSQSFGMNKAFHALGYTYGGRMTNNCMIYSGMEDMNVWHKSH